MITAVSGIILGIIVLIAIAVSDRGVGFDLVATQQVSPRELVVAAAAAKRLLFGVCNGASDLS